MKSLFVVLLFILCFPLVHNNDSFSENLVNGSSKFIKSSSVQVNCQTIDISMVTIPENKVPNYISTATGKEIEFKPIVTFSDNPDGAVYEWDFGDGTKATSREVSHTYFIPDNYQLILKITDFQGCQQISKITVNVINDIISVNSPAYPESSFSLEELVSEVLISGSCSEISNATSTVFGAATDLENKSYGYFNKGGSNGFPFEEGIILSTGIAHNAGNVKQNEILSQKLFQPGDADLEVALQLLQTYDATSIKFTFIPVSENISFRYLMASEEYMGGYQCYFSDGFAFLLREVGETKYQNLAVLNDGTPVNVTNINDDPSCARNVEYFAGYKIGETNYRARTKVLTANAKVIPNKEYEIKLVIADQSDEFYDTAIFLEANSFNIGASLGKDFIVSDNSAGCYNQSITLSTGANYAAHTWFKDGVTIIDETSPSLTVTDPGNYSVEVVFSADCVVNDSVIVEFFPPLHTQAPKTVYGCEINVGRYSFNLASNNAQILGTLNLADYDIQYFETLANANSDQEAIVDVADYSGQANQDIFVRVTDKITGCFNIDSFQLTVVNPPYTSTVSDIILCDINQPGDGKESFDLTANENDIINGQTDITLTYFLNNEDAEASKNPIGDPTTYINTNRKETIYVRLTDDRTGCFNIAQFDIILNDLLLLTSPSNYIICENNTDGLANFNLATKNSEILESQENPNDFKITYYTSKSDVETFNNPLSYNFVNSTNPQVIYYNVLDTNTGCFVVESLLLEVQELLEAYTPSPYVICDYFNENDGFAEFDLSTLNAELLGPQDPLSHRVSYYVSERDAEEGVNAIKGNFVNTSNPQIVFARIDSAISVGSGSECNAISQVTLQVNLLPIVDLQEEYILCTSFDTSIIQAPVLNTGLPDSDYAFIWYYENQLIVNEAHGYLLAEEIGEYKVEIVDLLTGCALEVYTRVIPIDPPQLTASVITRLFEKANTIKAEVIGNSTYEFSLDDGPWQTNPEFKNVTGGMHNIQAREINGCGLASVFVSVVDYPRFFTPNGDGYNDTWNIVEFGTQQSAKIYIFDRYGQLLALINTSGPGWDGVYNGNLLAGDDYWFRMDYLDPISSEPKTFKGHFTLKR